MLNFIGAVASSFVFGFVIGSGIKRFPAVIYAVLFVVVVVFAFMIEDYPFYVFEVGRDSINVNVVFVTSFAGLLVGSLLLGGRRGKEGGGTA